MGQETSATQVASGSIVLVTWGASNCTPRVAEITDVTAESATVSFAAIDGPCTRDLAPRATLVEIPELSVGSELSLVNLDGATEPSTVTVIG